MRLMLILDFRTKQAAERITRVYFPVGVHCTRMQFIVAQLVFVVLRN